MKMLYPQFQGIGEVLKPFIAKIWDLGQSFSFQMKYVDGKIRVGLFCFSIVFCRLRFVLYPIDIISMACLIRFLCYCCLYLYVSD